MNRRGSHPPWRGQVIGRGDGVSTLILVTMAKAARMGYAMVGV